MVVDYMQSCFFSYLGLVILISLVGGVLFFAISLWLCIWLHRGCATLPYLLCRYCSADIGVACICLVLYVMIIPLFVTMNV